jgi:hypothetical protein
MGSKAKQKIKISCFSFVFLFYFFNFLVLICNFRKITHPTCYQFGTIEYFLEKFSSRIFPLLLEKSPKQKVIPRNSVTWRLPDDLPGKGVFGLLIIFAHL